MERDFHFYFMLFEIICITFVIKKFFNVLICYLNNPKLKIWLSPRHFRQWICFQAEKIILYFLKYSLPIWLTFMIILKKIIFIHFSSFTTISLFYYIQGPMFA